MRNGKASAVIRLVIRTSSVRLSAQFTWKISAWTARRFWEIARRSLCISRDQRGPVTSSRTISTSSFYAVAMLDGELRWFSQGRYLARMKAWNSGKRV